MVARVAPDVAEQLRAVLDGLPPGHRLTADDVARCWPDRPAERAPQRLHALDPAAFRPASPAPGQQVRELTEVDHDDVERFLGQCSEDDHEEGDVGIGGEHELRLLDGPRVVLYRYSLDDLGSAGVAHSLALAPLGVAESVRPVVAA